jgi:hypothetical protein
LSGFLKLDTVRKDRKKMEKQGKKDKKGKKDGKEHAIISNKLVVHYLK